MIDTSKFGVRKFTSLTNVKVGTVVQFSYNGEQKYVGIITPNWENELHGVDLGEVTGTIMDWFTFVDGEKGETDGYALYSKFKTSRYYHSRPFRKYKKSKISAFREVFIKKDT